MAENITIGFDIAKNVFQVHGVDGAGQIVVRRQLRRAEVLKFFSGLAPCLVGMEACGSAHYWARQVSTRGHTVRLLPPAHVKPYVRRGKKNDAADAAAICEAVSRPHMQTVAIKSAEQQGVLMLHRTRDLMVRQRTMLICALRSHLAEFGVVAGRGKGSFAKLVAMLDQAEGQALPEPARSAFRLLVRQVDDAAAKIEALEKAIVAHHRSAGAGRLLSSIPGIGPITASVARRRCAGRLYLQIGPPVRCLARVGPKTELDWRQAAAQRHHQSRRPLSPPPAGHRRHRPHPLQA